MIVIDYFNVLSKHGSGQRLHGLSGVGIVLGGLWVVLKLEWNPLHPRTPSVKPVGISQASTSVSTIFIFSSFLTSAATSFSVPTVDALPVFLLYFECLVRSECSLDVL